MSYELDTNDFVEALKLIYQQPEIYPNPIREVVGLPGPELNQAISVVIFPPRRQETPQGGQVEWLLTFTIWVLYSWPGLGITREAAVALAESQRGLLVRQLNMNVNPVAPTSNQSSMMYFVSDLIGIRTYLEEDYVANETIVVARVYVNVTADPQKGILVTP